MGIHKQAPYKVLGNRLRKLRVEAQKSLLEVAGAIEIDDLTLQQIESGMQLPEEEILALLISHFDVDEPEADKLWSLAGYSKKEPIVEEQLLKQVMMVIPMDNRVVYSDDVKIDASRKGVVIEFNMSAGGTSQNVSRIGMSMEQAKSLYMQLGSSLHAALKPQAPRQLPPSTKINKQNPK